MNLESIIFEIVAAKTVGTSSGLETMEIVKLVTKEPNFKFSTYGRIKYALEKLHKEKKIDKAYGFDANVWSAEYAKCYLHATEDFRTDKEKGIDTMLRINKENGVIVERFIARRILEQQLK